MIYKMVIRLHNRMMNKYRKSFSIILWIQYHLPSEILIYK